MRPGEFRELLRGLSDQELLDALSPHRISRRRFLLSSTAAGSLAALSAIGLTRTQTPAYAAMLSPRQSITAAIGTGIDEGPYYVALQLGYWSSQGLDVKATDPPTGIEALNEVVAGQAVSASVGSTVMFSAAARGLPIKMIAQDHGTATKANYGTCSIVAAAGVTQPGNIAGLKGKRIGTRLGTDGEGALMAFITSAGLTRDDVKIVNMSPPNALTSLEQGNIDAFCFFEPFPSIALLQIKGSVMVNTDYPPTYQPGCTMTSADYIRDHRDVLLVYVTGIAHGQHFTRRNPSRMIEINSTYIPSLPVAAAFSAAKRISFDPRLSKLVSDRFKQKTVPDLIKFGILPTSVDPVKLVDQVVDPSIIVEVMKAHPEYFSDLPPIPSGQQFQ